MDESTRINRALWDERAPVHAASPDYNVHRYAAEPDFISDVVRFDQPRLGSIEGLDGVHLQCHIGTDTVSLARLGARMEGLDFSPPALVEARRLAGLAGVDVTFHEGDLYDAPDILGRERFDLVFTGIGALCWLPSIGRWAAVVAALLRPGGRLFLREGHPVLWSLAENRPELVIEHPYFEQVEPSVWDGPPGTYVSTDATLVNGASHEWNRGLGEIVTALLDHGLRLTGLEEHRSAPWEALPGLMTYDAAIDEWRLTDRPDRLPLTYTLQAVRPT